MRRLSGSLLDGLGGGGLLDDVLSPQPPNVGRGNDVLGQIFGSRDVSRAVAQNAAGQTGLDPALLRKMLPILAMLAAGYMARQHGAGAAGGASGAAVGAGAALPGGLGGLLGGAGGGGAGGLAGALGGMLGGGGSGAPQAPGGSLASMLDLDGDGNPLDDILGMAGKLVR